MGLGGNQGFRLTGIVPDFITVDGGEGGTGAAPQEFSDRLGMPLREGLIFVHNALVGIGVRDDLRLAASGKRASSYEIASAMALGANWCNIARGFMFSVGCIQSQSCHTNTCPVGVATQNQRLQLALVVEDKARLRLPQQYGAGAGRYDGGLRPRSPERVHAPAPLRAHLPPRSA